jgi:hypothetical protein
MICLFDDWRGASSARGGIARQISRAFARGSSVDATADSLRMPHAADFEAAGRSLLKMRQQTATSLCCLAVYQLPPLSRLHTSTSTHIADFGSPARG